MNCFVRPDGSYYEGDRADAADLKVTQRPSAAHEWIGGAWVLNEKDDAKAKIVQLEAGALLSQRTLRDIALAVLPLNHPSRKHIEALEAALAPLRTKAKE